MTDWGVHLIDYALYGMNAGLPKTITAIGGPFAYPELYQEAPDTMSTMYEFDKFNMLWDHAMGIDNGLFLRDHGISFIGNNGTLELDRGGWEVVEEKQSAAKATVPRKPAVGNGLDLHWVNFIEAVRAKDASKLRCPIETGAHIATISQMGNIAFRSGQKLYWDEMEQQESSKTKPSTGNILIAITRMVTSYRSFKSASKSKIKN